MCIMCQGADIDDVMADVRRKIKQFGYTVIGIEGSQSPYAYTVGLHQQQLPELYIAGTSPVIARGILADLIVLHQRSPLQPDAIVHLPTTGGSYRIDRLSSTGALRLVNHFYRKNKRKPTALRIVPLNAD